jgi:hypothetical protein
MVIRGQCDFWSSLFLVKVVTMDKIAFTGHRHLQFNEAVGTLASIHQRYPDAIWITGGAIGLDSHAAEYAHLHDIPL